MDNELVQENLLICQHKLNNDIHRSQTNRQPHFEMDTLGMQSLPGALQIAMVPPLYTSYKLAEYFSNIRGQYIESFAQSDVDISSFDGF